METLREMCDVELEKIGELRSQFAPRVARHIYQAIKNLNNVRLITVECRRPDATRIRALFNHDIAIPEMDEYLADPREESWRNIYEKSARKVKNRKQKLVEQAVFEVFDELFDEANLFHVFESDFLMIFENKNGKWCHIFLSDHPWVRDICKPTTCKCVE